MPLGLRLAVIVLLASVPIFLIQIVHELDLREVRRARLVADAQNLAEQIASRQNRFIEAGRFLLTAIARAEDVRSGEAVRCSRELARIHAPFPEITGIGVVQVDGWSHCSSTGRRTPINLADRPYFQAALRTRTMQTSGFIVGRIIGSGSFVLAYPTVNDERAVESVIILAFSSEIMSRALNDPPLPEGAFAAMLDAEGEVIARWPDPEAWIGRNLSDLGWAKAALKSRYGAMQGRIEGVPGETAIAYAPMQAPTNITVVTGKPITPQLRGLDVWFWRDTGLIGTVFLLAAIAAWLGALFGIQRPIRAINNHVEELSRGRLDTGSVVPSGIVELKQLTEHFRSMANALAAREAELKEALRQKDMLLKEVNHRVKNSLQMVASLFHLQRARIGDPEARRYFEDATRRVSTVARVHQRLYLDEHIDTMSFDEFLIEMCDELGRALGAESGPRLECRAAKCRLPVDKAIPVALIVNELVTNAFKYGYPDNRAGTIRVICETALQEVALSVSDDGEPLPPAFDPAKSEGLGMKLVSALTTQIGGKLELIAGHAGKSFVVRFPA